MRRSSAIPDVFSTHFVSVVRAGELSSKLPETLDDLKEYLEWVERVMADVRQATLYPAIVITVVSAFVLFLFSTIIPKFARAAGQAQCPATVADAHRPDGQRRCARRPGGFGCRCWSSS